MKDEIADKIYDSYDRKDSRQLEEIMRMLDSVYHPWFEKYELVDIKFGPNDCYTLHKNMLKGTITFESYSLYITFYDDFNELDNEEVSVSFFTYLLYEQEEVTNKIKEDSINYTKHIINVYKEGLEEATEKLKRLEQVNL